MVPFVTFVVVTVYVTEPPSLIDVEFCPTVYVAGGGGGGPDPCPCIRPPPSPTTLNCCPLRVRVLFKAYADPEYMIDVSLPSNVNS